MDCLIESGKFQKYIVKYDFLNAFIETCYYSDHRKFFPLVILSNCFKKLKIQELDSSPVIVKTNNNNKNKKTPGRNFLLL